MAWKQKYEKKGNGHLSLYYWQGVRSWRLSLFLSATLDPSFMDIRIYNGDQDLMHLNES